MKKQYCNWRLSLEKKNPNIRWALPFVREAQKRSLFLTEADSFHSHTGIRVEGIVKWTDGGCRQREDDA